MLLYSQCNNNRYNLHADKQPQRFFFPSLLISARALKRFFSSAVFPPFFFARALDLKKVDFFEAKTRPAKSVSFIVFYSIPCAGLFVRLLNFSV